MQAIGVDKAVNKEIFRAIRPYFIEKLGKYTHQRVASDWHYHGLGFVREEMTYVFGINIGFFNFLGSDHYTHVGMNVLVRTNGINPDLRGRYRDFFRQNLHNWISVPESEYTSHRGGVGNKFERYMAIEPETTPDNVVKYLQDGIDGLYPVYYKIAENPDNIFYDVVRAAPPWEVFLVELAREKTGQPIHRR